MNKHAALRLCLLAGLSPVLAAPALALGQDSGYLYGGLGVGASRARIDQDRITAGLASAGLVTTDFSRDERGRAYSVFGGYQLSRNFGVEAGFVDLGKFGFAATTTPAGSLAGQIRLQGLHLDLVGTLPLTDRFSLLGRLGVQSTRARDHFAGGGAVTVTNPDPSARSTQAKFGAGVQYEFSPSFLLRAEAERFRVNDAVGNRGGVNLVSVSLVFPFGRTAAPAPRMAAAPVYMAPAPAPAPAPLPPPVMAPAAPPVVQAPPPAPRQRASFSAESLFGFDQFAIKPEGMASLDRFATEAKRTQFEVITVEGHTDRLGSTAYNQRLSQRRAEAVKDYLVSAGGIESGRINAAGRSESVPITKPEDCRGSQPNSKLIACLQPDRRVEIEVTGTR
ncbi:OmpA family protein [Paucibacter soli]|uniref:OmpA family protein n=1 Tax=Paucibacter soli TaxID=3133433 RepID=UPI0030A2E052